MSKFSEAELERRRQRMRKLNESGRAGGIYGHLGGRRRTDESREEAKARRRAAFEEALRLAALPKPPVTSQPRQEQIDGPSDTEEQVARAFRKGRPALGGWAIQGRPGEWYL